MEELLAFVDQPDAEAPDEPMPPLQVPDESCLLHLAGRAQDEGIEHSVFREPDFDNSVTAVALGPAGRRLVSNLALALRRAA